MYTKLHQITLDNLSAETKKLQAEGRKLKDKAEKEPDVVMAAEYWRRFDCAMRSIVFNLRRMNNIKRIYNETNIK